MTDFGNWLYKRMCETNLSAGELEKATGVSDASIYRYMNGTIVPKMETLEKIERVLGKFEKGDNAPVSSANSRPANSCTLGAVIRTLESTNGLTIIDSIENFFLQKEKFKSFVNENPFARDAYEEWHSKEIARFDSVTLLNIN